MPDGVAAEVDIKDMDSAHPGPIRKDCCLANHWNMMTKTVYTVLGR